MCGDAGESSGGATARRRRQWADLSRDVLVTILGKLDLSDLIAGVPFACTSWRDAVRDPSCWQVLDFRDWDAISLRLGCHRAPSVDLASLLRFSIDRCAGDALDAVYFPNFADEADLLYVAQRCPGLLYFSMDNPDISRDGLCDVVGRLKQLKGMAVDRNVLTLEVLLQVGQCCTNFSELKIFADAVDEDMASVICECLPNLRKLEVMDCTLPRQAVLTFLDELKELEYLDISGYANSGITGPVLEKASRLKVFRWDSIFDEGEFEYCSECEEDWFSQSPCECVVDRKVMEWLARLS